MIHRAYPGSLRYYDYVHRVDHHQESPLNLSSITHRLTDLNDQRPLPITAISFPSYIGNGSPISNRIRSSNRNRNRRRIAKEIAEDSFSSITLSSDVMLITPKMLTSKRCPKRISPLYDLRSIGNAIFKPRCSMIPGLLSKSPRKRAMSIYSVNWALRSPS